MTLWLLCLLHLSKARIANLDDYSKVKLNSNIIDFLDDSDFFKIIDHKKNTKYQ